MKSGHAACEILEPHMQWLQRISHLNGFKSQGQGKFC